MIIKCNLCNEDVDRDLFDQHLNKCHCLTYEKYYEYHKDVGMRKCMVCNTIMNRITPWLGIYCSCLDCNMKLYFESVMMSLDNIYNLLCSNQFIRLFILNDKLRNRLTRFDLTYYTNLLSEKFNNIKYDKINLFKIKIKKGFNPYVSDLNNIIFEKSDYSIKPSEFITCNDNNDSHYKLDIDGKEYKLYLPTMTEYHNNNHYKYNILNRKTPPQSSKKLLLGSGTCIKFHNTNFDRCKSIIKIYRNNKPIYSTSLTDRELDYIKYYIMTNTSMLKYIFNILYELIKNSDTLYDYAFLKNKVVINPSGKFNMILDWTINNSMMNSDSEQLNIAIL